MSKDLVKERVSEGAGFYITMFIILVKDKIRKGDVTMSPVSVQHVLQCQGRGPQAGGSHMCSSSKFEQPVSISSSYNWDQAKFCCMVSKGLLITQQGRTSETGTHMGKSDYPLPQAGDRLC
uniref:Uncharacterized protein n=1 Tax=Spermophilus dauricus TaxID=99837 RepID=A0A8C9PZT3_SPEDA